MQGNDIGFSVRPGVLIVYDGLLAKQPADMRRYNKLLRREQWAEAVNAWEWCKLPLTSLVWATDNLDAAFHIVTLQPIGFGNELQTVLSNLGVAVATVESAANTASLFLRLRLHQEIKQVLTALPDLAAELGVIKARLCDPNSPLPVR